MQSSFVSGAQLSVSVVEESVELTVFGLVVSCSLVLVGQPEHRMGHIATTAGPTNSFVHKPMKSAQSASTSGAHSGVSVAVVTLVVGGEVVFGTEGVLPAQPLQAIGHSAIIVGPINEFAQIETSVIAAHSPAVSGAHSRVAVIDGMIIAAVSVLAVLVSVVVVETVVSEVVVLVSCMIVVTYSAVECGFVNIAVGVAHEPHVAGQTSRKNAFNSPLQSEESLQKSSDS
jgi:hypothetical protein